MLAIHFLTPWETLKNLWFTLPHLPLRCEDNEDASSAAIVKLEACITDICEWMRRIILKLNASSSVEIKLAWMNSLNQSFT